MNEFELTVRRSALRMWLLAVVGVPFIIFGVDILFERRLATTITDLIYPTERVTPPPFETHDLLWAWVLLIAGASMTAWALKELIAPRRVIHADARGVAFAVAGPFAAAIRVPWSAIEDFDANIDHDEGGTFPTLRVLLSEPECLPTHPWGARWIDIGVLAIAGGDWDVDVRMAAEELREYAATHQAQLEADPVDASVTPTWLDEVAPETEPEPLVEGPWLRTDVAVRGDDESDSSEESSLDEISQEDEDA